jgi:dephospho-CoA kinase
VGARTRFAGLTGGIGSGKSAALAALERLGVATLSTDAVVHELLQTEEVRDLLVAELGPEVAPDGAVDRARVAEAVFGDESRRQWLESALWPRVGERVLEWRSEVERSGVPLGVVEVPLLFEAGMQDVFDCTVAIVAPEPLRAERAGERGHEALDERAARQLSQEDKAQRADYVVHNDGGLDELERKMSELVRTIASG